MKLPTLKNILNNNVIYGPTNILSTIKDNRYDLVMLDSIAATILSNNNNEINETYNTSSDSNEIYQHNDENNSNEVAIDESKINYTDPQVCLDSTLSKNVIVVSRDVMPSNANDEGEVDNNQNDTLSDNREEYRFTEIGSIYPLINFNGRILSKEEIAYLNINLNDFIPTFELGILDKGLMTNSIKQIRLGMDNDINIIIRPQINGAYKSLNFNFFAETLDYDVFNGQKIFKCKGKYKLKELYQCIPRTIPPSGAITKPKNEDDTYKLSTWEFLYTIAHECKLGYQYTEKCEDIYDDNLRIKTGNQNYIDFIKSQMSFGGADEHSIFDCWISANNSLTLINVAWIFEQLQTLSPLLLKCYALVGIENTDGKNMGNSWQYTNRTLTNMNTVTNSNMTFSSNNYILVSNNDVRNKGLNSSTITLGVIGFNPNSNGSMNTLDVVGIENSVDGRNFKDNYDIKSYPDVELDMSSNGINKINQRSIIKTFFELKRANKVILTLDQYNFALQRGCLVNIAYFVYTKEEKAFILNNWPNLFGDESHDIKPLTLPSGKTIQDIIEDNYYPLLDISRSGIFYIDKVFIKYNYVEQSIKQTLEIIKIGDQTSFQNKSSGVKFGKIKNDTYDNSEQIKKAPATTTVAPSGLNLNTTPVQNVNSSDDYGQKNEQVQQINDNNKEIIIESEPFNCDRNDSSKLYLETQNLKAKIQKIYPYPNYEIRIIPKYSESRKAYKLRAIIVPNTKFYKGPL